MKFYLKNSFNLGILIVGILFLVTNCQKDDVLHHEIMGSEIPIKKGFQIKKVTLEELKKNTIVKNSLDKIEGQLDYNKKSLSNSKTKGVFAKNLPINSKDDSFTILTDEILEVSTNTSKVYTFRIENPTDKTSSFENFVIHKYADNTIEYYIYKYKSNETDFISYILTRERVSSNQINTSNFDDYLSDKMFYDKELGCWVEITSDGGSGNLYIDFLCSGGGGAISGGTNGGAGGTGTGTNYGDWVYSNPDGDTSNGCIRTRSYTDANGNIQTETEYGVPCLEGTSTSNSATSSPGATTGSGNTYPDTGGAHSDSDPYYQGGGSGSTAPDTNTSSSNPTQENIVGVLPSEVEADINKIVNCLVDATLYNELKTLKKEDLSKLASYLSGKSLVNGSFVLNCGDALRQNFVISVVQIFNHTSLTQTQKQWVLDFVNATEVNSIRNFLVQNHYSSEANDFAKLAIESLMVGQKFDFTESFKSPFNVDLSDVKPDQDPNTHERDKEVFMHVYNKLIETPEFKRIFIDVFGEESRFTVKFKIQDNLQCGDAEDPNGCTIASIKSVNGKPTNIVNNLITITLDKNHLETSSFISIAKTIIHEAIHANIQLLEIRDKSLALPLIYNHSADAFASILLNRFNNNDHLFMANYYIPTMSKTLESIMPLLYSQERIQQILNEITILDLTGSGLGELEKFNFDHFYENYPWAGLHKTTEFNAHFIINRNYALYLGYVNAARSFGHVIP